MRLILIRRGATAWSVSGEHTGRTDIALSLDGWAQLVPLESNLRKFLGEAWDDAHAYSSPLSRALVSVRTVMGKARDIRIDDRLVEYDYGDYEGLTPTQIRDRRPGWDIWLDGCPGGETVEDVGRRLDAFLVDVSATADTVVVFAHSHVIRIMGALAVVAGRPRGPDLHPRHRRAVGGRGRAGQAVHPLLERASGRRQGSVNPVRYFE